MVISQLLVGGALVAALSTIPYGAVAISYRHRDNGLAYILLLAGLGVWNAMSLTHILSPDPLVKGFFLALSVVGAVLTGLGWFLFASTGSGTDDLFDLRAIYGLVAVLGGLDIALAISAPLHTVYWTVHVSSPQAPATVSITPGLGYWLHTGLLVLLFGLGFVLFVRAWRRGTYVPYSRAYSLACAGTILAILGSNLVFPGAIGVASITATSLSTIGWLQASSR